MVLRELVGGLLLLDGQSVHLDLYEGIDGVLLLERLDDEAGMEIISLSTLGLTREEFFSISWQRTALLYQGDMIEIVGKGDISKLLLHQGDLGLQGEAVLLLNLQFRQQEILVVIHLGQIPLELGNLGQI